MDNSIININRIVNEIDRLDYNDKINILSRIVNLIKREEKVHPKERETTQIATTLIQLKGLGKNVWQKNDAASYISTERDSWD